MAKKKLFLIITIATLTLSTSCTTDTVYTIDELMEVANTQVDNEVTVRGLVNHVCEHTAKKCFIVNETNELSLRINAGGDIDIYDKKLIGSKIQAVGILKEQRIDKEAIDNNEKEALANIDNEEEHDSCQAMLVNVEKMRKWMEKNNKDYYALYYVDGLRYMVIN